MKGYKGFTKDLKCRDKQYEIGGEYTEESAKLCQKGIHFCEHPLNCFDYYAPNESRYCEIEAPDEKVSPETEDDTKRVTTQIKIGVELGIRGLVEAAVDFVFKRATWNDSDKATGYQGAASATGTRGAAIVTGPYANSRVTGDKSVAVAAGYDCSASGIQGSVLFLIERDDDGDILHHTSVMVDGDKLLADTPYKLVNGEVVRV